MNAAFLPGAGLHSFMGCSQASSLKALCMLWACSTKPQLELGYLHTYVLRMSVYQQAQLYCCVSSCSTLLLQSFGSLHLQIPGNSSSGGWPGHRKPVEHEQAEAAPGAAAHRLAHTIVAGSAHDRCSCSCHRLASWYTHRSLPTHSCWQHSRDGYRYQLHIPASSSG